MEKRTIDSIPRCRYIVIRVGEPSANRSNVRTRSGGGMSGLGYCRCVSRRGFRVHPSKRLSVKTLRVRFVCLVRLLSWWSRAYRKALQALRRGIGRDNRSASVLRRSKRDSRFGSSSGKPLVKEMNYMGSNSFHAEAIKECLEFIKRNSVSAEESQLNDPDEDRVQFPPKCVIPQTERLPFHGEMSSNTILLSKIV